MNFLSLYLTYFLSKVSVKLRFIQQPLWLILLSYETLRAVALLNIFFIFYFRRYIMEVIDGKSPSIMLELSTLSYLNRLIACYILI
jgi:hypothetical protein